MDKIKQFFSKLSYDIGDFFGGLEFSDLEKKITLGAAGFFAFCLLVWLICFALFFETVQKIFGILALVGFIGTICWIVGLLLYKRFKG